MGNLNRTAVIVIPKEPFLDWVHQSDPDDAKITLADLHHDLTVYLLDKWAYLADFELELKAVYEEIFEEALASWYTDEEMWPKNRSYQEFQRWFDCSPHSMVIDLG
jgi:hypothetical protein